MTMKNRRIKSVVDVAQWSLCLGCGVCVHACPENNIRLVDVPDRGIRPYVELTKCKLCGECIKVCPGIELSHQPFNSKAIPDLLDSWGPVLEVWEGYAADPDIRFKASSGGAATALALFCLEKENFSGVLHIGTNPSAPLQNVPVFSKSKEELLVCTGSRYSPAAPCEKLNWIEQAESDCVFIGKPCDVVALRKSQVVKPSLGNKGILAISIFCAGTPTTKGTYDLLAVLGIKPDEAEELRYRGHGWPGMTVARIKGNHDEVRQMTYEECWGNILSHYGQFRCRLCPDGTGEFADISCGDPWYREIEPDEPGRSLVLIRTERGHRILHKAMEAGYIELERVQPKVLAASQKSLLNKRQNLFGRLLAMRMMLVPTPRFSGFSLAWNWRRLTWTERLRSILGTFRRVIMRGWLRPREENI